MKARERKPIWFRDQGGRSSKSSKTAKAVRDKAPGHPKELKTEETILKYKQLKIQERMNEYK